jgi:hypothetical protein
MKSLKAVIAARLPLIAWLISLVVAILAVYVWGGMYHWRLNQLGVYQIFPVFGLLAFSLMWSQYLVTFLRSYSGAKGLHRYFTYTGYVVLTAILVHPSLFVVQLYKDGFGLPPASYHHFVPETLVWVVLLGTLSWFLLLAFEFRRIFGTKSWWRFMNYAVDLAILAIFYHGLRLGDQLRMGWFTYVWYFYGVTLVLMLAHKYWRKIRTHHAV